MEEPTNRQIPHQKIFKDKAFWVGTFIGGPLVAGYLMAENFKVFKDSAKAKKSWIFAILTTIVVFVIAFSIPENINIPNQLIPLVYTGIAYFLVIHFQGDKIKEHFEAGGKAHNWWRIIGLSLIGLVVTTLPILGTAYFIDSTGNFGTDTRSYGNMKHEIGFDKDNIAVTEINEIAQALTKTTYFDDALSKFVYVKKENTNYIIYLPVVEGIENNQYALAPFVQLREDMQNEFPNNPIIMNLVVDYLDNVVKKLE